MQMRSQQLQGLLQFAAADPVLEPAMAGLERWIFLGQLTPLCSSPKDPQQTIENRTRILPRPSAIVPATRWPQHRLHHCPLFVVQFPASRHQRVRSCSEHLQNATY